MSQHLRVRMLCEGAVFVALAEILGFLKIGHLPNGGSVSLLMLPMIVFEIGRASCRERVFWWV